MDLLSLDFLVISIIILSQHGTQFVLTSDPMEAAQNTNVLTTDLWLSLGQENEQEQRAKDFQRHRITMQVKRTLFALNKR